MALLFFLEIDGTTFSSEDSKNKGKADVYDWQWGASHPASVKGGGAASGKTAFSSLHFTTNLDNGSTDMYLFCANGKTIPKATLSCFRESGDARIKYLEIKLEHVIVTGYSSSTGESPRGSYSLDFAKATVEFTEQTKSGGSGATVSHYWDVNSNTGG
jgi:type VI secretion system secreted protein Hcp